MRALQQCVLRWRHRTDALALPSQRHQCTSFSGMHTTSHTARVVLLVCAVSCVLHAGEVITRLGEQLQQAGMQEVFAIPRARMPVVKFVHPGTGAALCVATDCRHSKPGALPVLLSASDGAAKCTAD